MWKRYLVLVFRVGRRKVREALSNELGLILTSLGGLRLLHQLSTASSLASTGLELAHVLSVALDLLLLGVGTAREESGGGGTRGLDKRNRSKSLHDSNEK